MTRGSRFVGALLSVAVTALSLAACGVPNDDAPRDINASDVPYNLLDPSTTVSPTSAPEATMTATVYLVGPSNQLAPVRRQVSQPATVDATLATLIQGATPSEQASGLRSAINQQTAVIGAAVTNGVAMVDVSDAFSGVGAQEQILALAQLVYTATENASVKSVQVLLNSAVVEVPRADGTLTGNPLTRADYATLAPQS